MIKINRKDKKKLRAIMLCHTGNPMCRKLKLSKEQWIKLRVTYDVWFNLFKKREYSDANKVTNKNIALQLR